MAKIELKKILKSNKRAFSTSPQTWQLNLMDRLENERLTLGCDFTTITDLQKHSI